MTKLRKEINQEKWNKLLLKDATAWQVFRWFCINNKSEIWCGVVALGIGLVFGATV